MSRLMVFTVGSNLDLLLESCSRVMITPAVYDCKWTDYVTVKLRGALKFLSGQWDIPEFLMWVDGDDSLILKPEEEILARVQSFGGPVIISAESNCWPDADQADKYPKAPGHQGPQYINAGGYIGPRNQVMSAMHRVVEMAEGGDDQRAWTKAYLSKQLPQVVIDHSRRLFSSIADGEDALRADSCVKHWNGRTEGREEYWRSICDIRVP